MQERDTLFNDGKHEEYRKLSKKINDMIRQSEEQLIQSKVEKNEHKGTIWNAMDYITHRHKKRNFLTIFQLQQTNSIFFSLIKWGNYPDKS